LNTANGLRRDGTQTLHRCFYFQNISRYALEVNFVTPKGTVWFSLGRFNETQKRPATSCVDHLRRISNKQQYDEHTLATEPPNSYTLVKNVTDFTFVPSLETSSSGSEIKVFGKACRDVASCAAFSHFISNKSCYLSSIDY
jgi:hypothetical protein